MKKYFLLLCGLFFAANAFAAIPGGLSSIPSDHEGPGRLIDIDCHEIISGYSSRIITVPDIEIEKAAAQIPNREGCDADSFDPEIKPLSCTGGNGILTIAQQFSTTAFQTTDTVSTQQGNRARAP